MRLTVNENPCGCGKSSFLESGYRIGLVETALPAYLCVTSTSIKEHHCFHVTLSNRESRSQVMGKIDMKETSTFLFTLVFAKFANFV